MTAAPGGDRTRVRRLPEKAVTDRAVLDAILDAGLVAHLAVVESDQPFVIPVAYARDGDRVLFHGSTASRLFRALAAGAPTCLTVTLLDGLVVARSTFESSMHYRSAMVLGVCRSLQGDAKEQGLDLLVEHLLPGRLAHTRRSLPKEVAATSVLELPLAEWSIKVSAGPPDDLEEDVDLPIWAGTVPIRERFGEPVDAPDLRADFAGQVPDYVRAWRR